MKMDGSCQFLIILKVELTKAIKDVLCETQQDDTRVWVPLLG
jgi:hypothetical protein